MAMEGYSILWLLMIAGGAAALGGAIAWGMAWTRYRTRGEAAVSEVGSRRLYEDENRRARGQ